jgi:hypothetical protein
MMGRSSFPDDFTLHIGELTMLRFTLAAVAAICLLLAPAASVADWYTKSGSTHSNDATTSVSPGQCVYETQAATGQGSPLYAPILPMYFKVNANIAGTDEGDVEIEVRRCPVGTTAYSANVCQRIEYKNAAGTMVGVIDGDLSDGMDAVYDVRGAVYFLNTTTHPQGTSDSGTTTATLDGSGTTTNLDTGTVTNADTGTVTNADTGTVTNSDTGTVTAAVSSTSTTAESGTATAGGSTTTLIDTNKDWEDDQWNGYRVTDTVQAETGTISDTTGATEAITFSPAFTLAPDSNAYQIKDGLNTLTDTAKSWTVDEWAGYRVTNSTKAETTVVASNTATTLTVSPAWTTEPDPSDSYVIIDGTATITDTGQSWTPDEWIGYRAENTTSAETSTITGNDADTLTVSPIWTTEPEVSDSFEIIDGTTTLTASAETWDVDAWAGYRVTNDTAAETTTITSNTATQLTVSTWTTEPEPDDTFTIIDGTSTLTATAETWDVDGWVGYRVTNTTAAETTSVASNTADTLTVSPVWTTEPDPADSFVIIDGTATITDTGQTWTPSEWADYRVTNTTTAETTTISDNTATALTVSPVWATEPTVTDTFEIIDGTGTLTDTGQTWDVDEWNGYRVENTTGTETASISDTTANQLVVSPAWTTAPDKGDSYRIIDGTGTITDTAQDWADDDWNTYQITNTTTGESSVITDTFGTPDFYLTVSPAFTTAADFGDSYIVFETYRTSEVEACVDAE